MGERHYQFRNFVSASDVIVLLDIGAVFLFALQVHMICILILPRSSTMIISVLVIVLLAGDEESDFCVGENTIISLQCIKKNSWQDSFIRQEFIHPMAALS